MRLEQSDGADPLEEGTARRKSRPSKCVTVGGGEEGRPGDDCVTSVSKEDVKTDVSGVLSAGPVVEAGKAMTMPGGQSWELLSPSIAAPTVRSVMNVRLITCVNADCAFNKCAR